jgi:hypothetical protein
MILIPFFGDTEKFRPLLDRWFACAKLAMPDARPRESFVLLTDNVDAGVKNAALAHDCGVADFNLDGWADLCRPGHPFDVKGALVCSFLLAHGYRMLVLDADAFLARDPFPTLNGPAFENAPIAMPLDHGAVIYWRAKHLTAPYAGVLKRCAGVQWFGASDGRSRLAAGYRRAHQELLAMPRLPWEPQLPHLVEQYAWSICAHRKGGVTLPATMNWHEDHLGKSADAIVNHHYGHPKWRGVGAPANV